jgi:Zn-dependent protease
VLERGYFRIARFRGAPIRIHWTFPLGAFLFAGPIPAGWAAFFVVILVHELGHAFFVRRFGLAVVGIDLHGAGGECRYILGHETSVQRAIIAWGGILAQALLLGVGQGLAWLASLAKDSSMGLTLEMLLVINLYVMLLNAIPCPPLDGWQAWRLFRWAHVRALFRRRHTRRW